MSQQSGEPHMSSGANVSFRHCCVACTEVPRAQHADARLFREGPTHPQVYAIYALLRLTSCICLFMPNWFQRTPLGSTWPGLWHIYSTYATCCRLCVRVCTACRTGHGDGNKDERRLYTYTSHLPRYLPEAREAWAQCGALTGRCWCTRVQYAYES